MGRRRGVLGAVVWGIGAWISSSAWAATYTVDADHTAIGFTIRHLLSNVQGTFDAFEAAFEYVPEHPEQWKANATIQATSINTRVSKRDTHLRSKDFFDVETYPTITFTSTEVTDVTPTSAKLHGLLTIHGVEKPVVLDVQLHGEAKDPWGHIRAGVTARTRINRKEFGLTWNKALETGQLLVGEEVDVTLEVEGIRQGGQ